MSHSVSGAVTADGAPLPGVEVTLEAGGTVLATATTDAAGAYAFPGLADADYTVAPALTGYAFTPESRAVTLAGADSTGVDFAATLLPVDVGPIAAPLDPLAVTAPFTASATFADPSGTGVASAIWDWGDGTTSAGGVDGGAVTGTHAYAEAGVYTVTLTVVNGLGGVGEATYQYVVVYDPSAGFVTGGGWIDSPPGAYPADSTLTGRANFGFNAKYRQGQSVPGGQTQFKFQTAAFSFHSTAYQWLVVAGPQAKYKGTGRVNGAGDYGFMLTAIDGQRPGGGGVDRFRIKIWDRADGDRVVYDNQMGAPDDGDDATALGGGSIVIHTGGGASVLLGEEVPDVFSLQPPYPNPFRGRATLRLGVPEADHVAVVVYDVLGRAVARLHDGELAPGWYAVTLDGGGLASGAYFVRMTAEGGFQQVQRLTILR